jgi:type VI secretion system protein ImpH
MGTASRMETADLSRREPADRLAEDPTAFGFFQAVRLLERLHPKRAPVGGFADPAEEVARFRVPATLAFPPSEIQAMEQADEGPASLSVNFLGLTGPSGVLPYHYTELVAERLRAKDPTLLAFLDLFHHRLISLFYRAWEKNRFLVAYERDQQDRLTQHLGHLIGLGEASSSEHRWVRRETLLHYAGHLAAQRRSAMALEDMLEEYLGVPVEVQQFVGAWYPLSPNAQCALDDEPRADAVPLGAGCPVGDELWDPQARVRLRIGPLRRAQFEDFLPRGSGHKALRELTHFYGGDGFEFEAQLVLDRRDVPPARLGADSGEGLPLGWGTWLCTRPMNRDPDDTVLTL